MSVLRVLRVGSALRGIWYKLTYLIFNPRHYTLLFCSIGRCRSLHTSLMLSSMEGAGVEKTMEITRIYSDKDGESKFGSFKISMRGSGGLAVQSCVSPELSLYHHPALSFPRCLPPPFKYRWYWLSIQPDWMYWNGCSLHPRGL